MTVDYKNLSDKKVIEKYIGVSRFMLDNKEEINENRKDVSSFVQNNTNYDIEEIGAELGERVCKNLSFGVEVQKELKKEFSKEELDELVVHIF